MQMQFKNVWKKRGFALQVKTEKLWVVLRYFLLCLESNCVYRQRMDIDVFGLNKLFPASSLNYQQPDQHRGRFQR